LAQSQQDYSVVALQLQLLLAQLITLWLALVEVVVSSEALAEAAAVLEVDHRFLCLHLLQLQ
jgi:hypothetical protein